MSSSESSNVTPTATGSSSSHNNPTEYPQQSSAGSADEESEEFCQLLELPDELLLHILDKLDFSSVLRTGTTCTRLNRLTRDDSVWSHLLNRDFTPEDRKEIEDNIQISNQEVYSALYKKKSKLPLLLWARNMARHKTIVPNGLLANVTLIQLGDNQGILQID